MHDPRDASSQLLKQLLSVDSPELGARLKQRLKAAFVSNGLGAFDEKSLGFQKFTDYLLRVHGDLVSVERREGLGDILVSLRSPSALRTSYAPAPRQPRAPSTHIIRSDVWQAFANPDPDRKRFFNKQTEKIVHYLEGKNGLVRAQVEAAPETFIGISPISQDVQAGWMREFLSTASIPSSEKEALEPLVAKPYSSAGNVTFSRALGAHSVAWRNYRTAHVTSIIEKWAFEAGIPIGKLHVAPLESVASATWNTGSMQTAGVMDVRAAATLGEAPPSVDQISPRQQILTLLELLTDEDITRLVLPTLLSTIMIKSRL